MEINELDEEEAINKAFDTCQKLFKQMSNPNNAFFGHAELLRLIAEWRQEIYDLGVSPFSVIKDIVTGLLDIAKELNDTRDHSEELESESETLEKENEKLKEQNKVFIKVSIKLKEAVKELENLKP